MRNSIIITLLLVASLAVAQVLTITWTWTAPISGSPAVGYYVQLSSDGASWTTTDTVASTTVDLEMPFTENYVRVIGYDAWGRSGEPSETSDPFSDQGPPGPPGKPYVVLIVLGVVLLILGLLFGRRSK